MKKSYACVPGSTVWVKSAIAASCESWNCLLGSVMLHAFQYSRRRDSCFLKRMGMLL